MKKKKKKTDNPITRGTMALILVKVIAKNDKQNEAIIIR